jgi:Rieske Fe-S protein
MTTTSSAVSRRAVLAGAAAVGAVSALAACGDSASSGTSATAQTSPVTVKAADIPVGGGKIYQDTQIVVTQPTAGSYKAFSAICTHQGCVVAKVDATTITCTCHNSMFSAIDGSVKQGPATSALPAKTVTANGADLTVS